MKRHELNASPVGVLRTYGSQGFLGNWINKTGYALVALILQTHPLAAQTTTAPDSQTFYDSSVGYAYDEWGDGEYKLYPVRPTLPPAGIEATGDWDGGTSMISEAKATRLLLQDVVRLLSVLVGTMLAHATLSKVRV